MIRKLLQKLFSSFLEKEIARKDAVSFSNWGD